MVQGQIQHHEIRTKPSDCCSWPEPFLSHIHLLMSMVSGGYCIYSWNSKQPVFNGCFNWMIPNHYVKSGCFTKHHLKNGCLGFQVYIIGVPKHWKTQWRLKVQWVPLHKESHESPPVVPRVTRQTPILYIYILYHYVLISKCHLFGYKYHLFNVLPSLQS